MIAVIKREWKDFQEGGKCVAKLTCSEAADIDNLPNSKNSDYAAGSTCICTEDTKVAKWMLGADDVWHIIEKIDYVESEKAHTVTLVNLDYRDGNFEEEYCLDMYLYSTDDGNSWQSFDVVETKVSCTQIKFKQRSLEIGGEGFVGQMSYESDGLFNGAETLNITITEDTTFYFFWEI